MKETTEVEGTDPEELVQDLKEQEEMDWLFLLTTERRHILNLKVHDME